MFQTINYLTRQYGLNYWTKQYGLIDGPWTALQYKLGDRSRKLFALTLPDFPAPIWLRGGTVDVFTQVLATKEYDISDTAQGKELRRRYDSLIASRVQPLIIDCGANIGLSGVWYARQFPEAKIIAVEPSSSGVGRLVGLG
jgi:hypothetical protein